MSQPHSFIPPVIGTEIQALLSQLGQYDDPYLLLLYSTSSAESRRQALVQSSLSEGVADIPVIELDDKVSFSLVFTNTSTIEVIADTLVGELGLESVYLSVFKHNCLSNANTTLNWAMQQLSEVIGKHDPDARLAINDFTDKANWPGIEQYLEQDNSAETRAESQQAPSKTKRSSVVKRVGRFLSGLLKNNSSKSLAFEPTEALLQLRPFIVNLPNGQALWQYVLSGSGKQELLDKNAFVDLDSVLLLLHAKQYASEFYQEILESVRYDCTPSQGQIHESLHRVFHYLIYELLEAETDSVAKQACFLRILDVFFGIFDQSPWSEQIQEILVEDEDTACISESEFQLRYSVESVEDGQVSALTQQAILELLDSLERYHFASYSDMLNIDKFFASSRLTYDPQSWQSTEPRSKLLLASILLSKDKEQGTSDDNTLLLHALVDDLLPLQVVKQISEELKPDSELPGAFESWVFSDSDQAAAVQAVLLRPLLAGGIGLHESDTARSAQPYYELYSGRSDFQPVLAACYWLALYTDNPLANKVIQLSLELAPQATLHCFARLHFAKRKRFLDGKIRKRFIKSLTSLNVDEYQILSFEMCIAQAADFDDYKRLVRRYNRYSGGRIAAWDKALNKVSCRAREQFYLDAHRLSAKAKTPLLSTRTEMLKELIHRTAYTDDDFFAAHFEKSQLLFSDHSEFLPESLHLPVRLHNSMRMNNEGCRFIVLRFAGDHLELLLDNANWPFNPEQEDWPHASHYIILNEDAELEGVFKTLEQFIPYQQRAKQLLKAMNTYLDGQLSFDEFQRKYGLYSEAKSYDINIEYYSEHSASVLPQILAEPDKSVQLRLVRLLTSHRTRGRRVLNSISQEMFFHDCMLDKTLDLVTYKEGIEVSDLTEEWTELWQAFKAEFEQQVMAVH